MSDRPDDKAPGGEKKKKKLTPDEIAKRALEALQLPEKEFQRRLDEFEKKRDEAAADDLSEDAPDDAD